MICRKFTIGTPAARPLIAQNAGKTRHYSSSSRGFKRLPLRFLCCLFCGGLAVAKLTAAEPPEVAPEIVGRLGTNSWLTPVNQIVTPAGRQVPLPNLRPQALALSPNGKLLVTSGRTAELVVVDPVTGDIRERVALPAEPPTNAAPEAVSGRILEPDKNAQVSYTGLVFSPDGTRLYLANVEGSIKVFTVSRQGKIAGLVAWPLPLARAPHRKAEIPAGLRVSADGRRLYVCGNLSNKLLELDAASGRLLRSWETGVAPYDVVITGGKAYVSNWGGRRPAADSLTGPAGQGTLVRVDARLHVASEGSVSVIGLEPGAVAREVIVGLHASALAVSPDGRWVVVANAASDTLSVLDTRTDQVTETIWARQQPSDLFGASPNALAFDKSGRQLFVCNGTQNAIAVFDFQPGASELKGLIPVGWFPAAIVSDAQRKAIYVANLKVISDGRPRKSDGRIEFNTHQYGGSLSLVPVPSAKELAAHTGRALANLREPRMRAAMLPPRPGQPPRPVPERTGEPSVFKHVIYIIKENRTYDQVLGDVPQGNGDADLCIYGELVTPNQHKLVREFALLDNTYCSGILSADGHQWANSAFVTDYLEKSFAGFPRSYPDGQGTNEVDALSYAPTGFIWDHALAHGRTVRDYGEFSIAKAVWKDPKKKKSPGFLDFYRDFITGANAISYSSEPSIESLRSCLVTNTIGWHMNVPDVIRAANFIRDLRQFEQTGNLPDFILLYLPNDHTSGTKAGAPTPAAQVADNDLAMGQVIEALSRSRFWKDTCLFAIEDDPQNGWDHVSGYRTTAYVVSPYTKRYQTVSAHYNQTSLLRTIELMLGLPPMNQMDATATAMTEVFTDTPDFTPFTAVSNNVPLDQINPEPKKVADSLLRKEAYASARLPLALPDKCPEDTLNRILWHAAKGPQAPYPQWAIKLARDDD